MRSTVYPPSRPAAQRSAFTLLELLVSMVILTLIVSVIAGMANSATRAWTNGEQTVENYQTGRALLEMIGREVSEAAISPKLQFVQDPTLPAGNAPSGANQRPSSSIFWVAPLSSTSGGDLCEVGYYLTNNFELKRFFVPPSDNTNYLIFSKGNVTDPTDYTPRATGNTGGIYDHTNAALWVTEAVLKSDANGRPLCTTVASCVLNFFVRCLDVNGDPIPWLDTGLKYNSAEPAQPTMPGLRNIAPATPAPTAPVNPSSFNYTFYDASNPTSVQNTAPGNLLPFAVELTIVTTDSQTLQRLGAQAVPPTPAIPSSYLTRSAVLPNVLPAAPLAVPANIAAFIQSAQTAGFKNARSFSTVVRLRNAYQ